MRNADSGYGVTIANGPDAPRAFRNWQLVVAWTDKHQSNWDHITG